MNKPVLKLSQSERQPVKGAKAALLTAKGIIAGVLVNWTDGGAVVEARGEVLAGAKVRLRVQGPDRIWEKHATVLWANGGQGFGLEFDDPAQKNRGSSIIPRIKQFFHSMYPRIANNRPALRSKNRSAERTGNPSANRPSVIDIQTVGKRDGSDKRRRRRFRIETSAQITWSDFSVVGPEIATITDASSAGVLFTTNRDYPIGTTLQVTYPYPNSNSPKQEGDVVRVENLPDGRRRVAVAFG